MVRPRTTIPGPTTIPTKADHAAATSLHRTSRARRPIDNGDQRHNHAPLFSMAGSVRELNLQMNPTGTVYNPGARLQRRLQPLRTDA